MLLKENVIRSTQKTTHEGVHRKRKKTGPKKCKKTKCAEDDKTERAEIKTFFLFIRTGELRVVVF